MASPKYTEICIIGAGVAGLSAAHSLMTSEDSPFGPQDVLVLEAQDRIGGRIHTDRTSSKLGLSYDLGAAWFHDSLTNSVLKRLIDEENFSIPKDGYFDDKTERVYSSEGEVDVVGLKLDRMLEDFERYVEIHYFGSLTTPDILLREMATVFVSKYSALLTDEQKHYCGRMARYLETWYGISHDDISAKYSIMDHEGRNLHNKQGYDRVIDMLAKDVNIDLNQQVAKIDRNNTDNKYQLKVETVQGMVTYCNYLVVTVPQSILQLESSHPYGVAWSPELPSSTQEALQTIHFGALGKVIFEFDSIWWDNSEDRFLVLGDEVSENCSKKLQELPKPFTFPAYVTNYSAGKGITHAGSLAILTQNPLTEYLESHPEEAWTYFKPMLSVLAKEPVSEPINTLTTLWTQNPYVRGSYLALHTGDAASDLILQLSGEFPTGLAASTVRFAGEHTILDGSGCVHGAYNSGIREAQWILNHAK